MKEFVFLNSEKAVVHSYTKSMVRSTNEFSLKNSNLAKGQQKILIFDFDGTIADTFNMVVSVINQLSSQFNYKKIEPHELDELRDMPAHKVIRHLQVPTWKLPMVVAKGRKLMRSEASSVKPVPGIPEVLRHLHSKHLGMGILTSNSKTFVHSFLRKNDLDLFDFIYASSSILGKAKRLNSVMRNNKLAPKNLLFIGDEIRDIDAARALKIKVLAVSWGYNSERALKRSRPDYLVTDPKELLHSILSKGGCSK